jgi:hypothetical protein
VTLSIGALISTFVVVSVVSERYDWVRDALSAVFLTVTLMIPCSPGRRTAGETSKSVMITEGTLAAAGIAATRRSSARNAMKRRFASGGELMN